MKNAWKRSVAAVVFVAALGSADSSSGGEQPPGSAGSDDRSAAGPGSAGLAQKTEKQVGNRARDLRTRHSEVAAELNAVVERLGALDQGLNQATTSDAEKIRDQLRELAAKARELEEIRARLQQQLEDLARVKKLEEVKPVDTIRIKIFRLKHRDANEVSAVLPELLPQARLGVGGGNPMGGMMGTTGGAGMMGGGMAGGGKGAMAGGMMGSSGGLKPGAGGMMGGQGMGSGMMGGGKGAMPGGDSVARPGSGGAKGGSGMMMGMQGKTSGASPFGSGLGEAPATPWRLAVDERTNSLIVRGTEEDLRHIGDVVAALDVPENKTATKLKNLRTFKLKNANVINVGQIVQQLGLNVNVSILEKSQMLVVHGSEAALKEVADLIAELDVEGKPIKDITPKQ